jgi:hypothetical protein
LGAGGDVSDGEVGDDDLSKMPQPASDTASHSTITMLVIARHPDIDSFQSLVPARHFGVWAHRIMMR